MHAHIRTVMRRIVGDRSLRLRPPFLACSVAISAGSADDSAMVLPTDPEPLIVDTAAGERSSRIEIADDVGERSRGLMFRETMDDDHGMLFVFEEQRPVGFWMKNTPMPLDLVFIDAGRHGEGGAARASRIRRRSSRRARRCVSCSSSRRGVAAQNRIEDGDKVIAIAADHRRPGQARTELTANCGAMQFFSHDGFDLALSTARRRPAGRADAAHPRLRLEPPDQLGDARLGKDAERGRLPRDRLRQSRPRRNRRRAMIRRTITPEKMAGDAAALLRPPRHRARACDRLFDGRAHQRVPGAGRAGAGRLRWSSAGSASAWWTASATGIRSPTRCSPRIRPTTDPRGRAFRTFADQTRSDRLALAACIETSRELISEAEISRIAQPTLIAVGTKDDIGGSPEALAALMPNAEAFAIEGRDHMLSVGDQGFKKRAARFPREHPLA